MNELLKAVAFTKTGLLGCKGMPFNPAARQLGSLTPSKAPPIDRKLCSDDRGRFGAVNELESCSLQQGREGAGVRRRSFCPILCYELNRMPKGRGAALCASLARMGILAPLAPAVGGAAFLVHGFGPGVASEA